MPKGGARVRSGPGADPNAIRRDKDHMEFEQLPAAGREGDAPAWPLSPAPTRREKTLWLDAWRRPQAVAWEARGQEHEVALYVRTLARAEKRDSTGTLLQEVRRMRDALGLTANGMKSLRWIIETGQQAGRPPTASATGTEGRPGVRWKPEVIDGGS